MGGHELDREVSRLVAERDVEGLWPLLGRMMSRKEAEAMTELLRGELEAGDPERLVEFHVQKGLRHPQRALLAGVLRAWLGSKRRDEAIAAIRRIVERKPEDVPIRCLLVQSDALAVDELRAFAVSGGVRSRLALSRLAIFALVRAGDGSWLLERLREGVFGQTEVGDLIEASKSDRRLSRQVVQSAGELEDPVLLRGVLERVDVARTMVERAMQVDDPAVRAAAMRHAHRLRDPLSILRAGLRHPDNGVRRAALEVLVERPDARAVPDVETLVDDPDPYDERYNTEPIGALARRFMKLVGSSQG